MTRNQRLVPLLLVILGLVPIAAWFLLAATLKPGGFLPNLGLAILVLLSPLPFGGLLMIAAAGLLVPKPRAGRIVATIGAAIVLAGTMLLSLFWLRQVAGCGGPRGICTGALLEALAGFAYALLHAGLIVLIWRAPRSRSDRAIVKDFPSAPGSSGGAAKECSPPVTLRPSSATKE